MGTMAWPSSEGQVCVLCGSSECYGFDQHKLYPKKYPFIKGGYDPLEGLETVIAPDRVIDPDTGTVVIGAGDEVPREYYDEMIKKNERAKHPTNDRMKRPSRDRSK
jgi:hypothetical protein